MAWGLCIGRPSPRPSLFMLAETNGLLPLKEKNEYETYMLICHTAREGRPLNCPI